jgi:hypothetical protein
MNTPIRALIGSVTLGIAATVTSLVGASSAEASRTGVTGFDAPPRRHSGSAQVDSTDANATTGWGAAEGSESVVAASQKLAPAIAIPAVTDAHIKLDMVTSWSPKTRIKQEGEYG